MPWEPAWLQTIYTPKAVIHLKRKRIFRDRIIHNEISYWCSILYMCYWFYIVSFLLLQFFYWNKSLRTTDQPLVLLDSPLPGRVVTTRGLWNKLHVPYLAAKCAGRLFDFAGMNSITVCASFVISCFWWQHFCHKDTFANMRPGGRLNIKMSSYQYRYPHVKIKTGSRPSYFKHGNPRTWERRSFYWDGALMIFTAIYLWQQTYGLILFRSGPFY